jgi:hypothetical protein
MWYHPEHIASISKEDGQEMYGKAGNDRKMSERSKAGAMLQEMGKKH